jgi:hypothetical protein
MGAAALGLDGPAVAGRNLSETSPGRGRMAGVAAARASRVRRRREDRNANSASMATRPPSTKAITPRRKRIPEFMPFAIAESD